jgi:hypothetical protein
LKDSALIIDSRDVHAARQELGKRWGLGRILAPKELAGILLLRGRDPGSNVLDWESGRSVISGPVQRVMEALLDGWEPEDLENHLRRAK